MVVMWKGRKILKEAAILKVEDFDDIEDETHDLLCTCLSSAAKTCMNKLKAYRDA
jgi:hypothetical protein